MATKIEERVKAAEERLKKHSEPSKRDLKELFTDLEQQASTGDAVAVNTLAWIASRCRSIRPAEVLDSYDEGQRALARTLPAAEAAWLTSLIDQDNAREHELVTACSSQIDQDRIDAMLSAHAATGDAASQWLLSEDAGNIADQQPLSRQAAAGGFAQAQYDLARQLIDR